MHSLAFSELFYIFTKYLIWPDVGFILSLAEFFDYENADNESANGELKEFCHDSTWAGLDPECAQFLILSWFFFNVKINSFEWQVWGNKA